MAMKSVVSRLIAGAALSLGMMAAANAGEAPSILGATQGYKAMSAQEMSQIKGEGLLCKCIALPPIKVKAFVYVGVG
jgi:hypothetical protein